ncbi:MAG: hypothetical protein RL497_1328 [Pseudomonadota bacterium]|jgi:transglutaminase-like putative cysteine protease
MPVSLWRQILAVALTAPSAAALLSLWLPWNMALLAGVVCAGILLGQWLLAHTEGDQTRLLLSSQWSLFASLLLSLGAIWWLGPLAALAAALSLVPGWAWFSHPGLRAFILQLSASGLSLLLALSLGQDAELALLCALYLPGLWLCLMPSTPMHSSEPEPLETQQTVGAQRQLASAQPPPAKSKITLNGLSYALAPVLLLALSSVFFLLSPRIQGAAWLALTPTAKLHLGSGTPASNPQNTANHLQQHWLLSPYSEPKNPPAPSAFPAFGERFALNQLPVQPAQGPLIARIKSPLSLNLQVSRFDHFDGTHWINTAQQQEPIALPADGLTWGNASRISLHIHWLRPNTHALAVPGGWQWLHAPSDALLLSAQGLALPQMPPPGFSYSVRSHGLSLDGHWVAQQDGVQHPNYLQIPDTLQKPLHTWLAANLPNLPGPWQQAQWLEHHLQTQYSADREAVVPSYQRDPILFYLNEQHQGRSETAASALTLLLRSLNIPARLSCGWALQQRNPFTGLFHLTEASAHCYSEAFINNHGWVELEPSPLYARRSSPRALSLGAEAALFALNGKPSWLAALLLALCATAVLGLLAWGVWRLWPVIWHSPPLKRYRLKRLAARTVSQTDPAAESLANLIAACQLIGYHFPPGTGIRPWACLWQTLVPQFDADTYCNHYHHHHFGLNTQGDITAQQQTLLKQLSEMPWRELVRWVNTSENA